MCVECLGEEHSTHTMTVPLPLLPFQHTSPPPICYRESPQASGADYEGAQGGCRGVEDEVPLHKQMPFSSRRIRYNLRNVTLPYEHHMFTTLCIAKIIFQYASVAEVGSVTMSLVTREQQSVLTEEIPALHLYRESEVSLTSARASAKT